MNTESSRAAFVTDVAGCLRAFCRNTSPPGTVGRLVRFAAAIARQRLFGRLRAAAAHEQTSIEQQSLSVIAGLFDKPCRESALCVALDGVLAGGDASLFAAFQAIVVRTAAQELFQRWGENDALSARLWRGLQRVVRHDPRIVAFPVNRPEWVALAGLDSLNRELSPVGHAELLRMVGRLYAAQRRLADAVFGTLSEIAERANCRRVVKIEALFGALREVVSQQAAAELEASVPSTPDPRLTLATEKASSVAREHSNSGVAKYLSAGKLDLAMAEVFRRAMRDLIADCADGGPAQAYYEYIRPYAPTLSLQEYRKSLRARFEYLAEGAQKAFAEAFRREFAGKSLQDGHRATMSDAEGGDMS